MRLYKVFYVDESGMGSYAHLSKGWALQYWKNLQTVPRYTGSLLFCFETLVSAKLFLENRSLTSQHFQIWEVEAEGVEELKSMSGSIFPELLAVFWEGVSVLKARSPVGTIGARAVTPLRKVWP